jgi:hypothetical protein
MSRRPSEQLVNVVAEQGDLSHYERKVYVGFLA